MDHCHHLPFCIGQDPTDERDPLGCCRCGDRAKEHAMELPDLKNAPDFVKTSLTTTSPAIAEANGIRLATPEEAAALLKSNLEVSPTGKPVIGNGAITALVTLAGGAETVAQSGLFPAQTGYLHLLAALLALALTALSPGWRTVPK